MGSVGCAGSRAGVEVSQGRAGKAGGGTAGSPLEGQLPRLWLKEVIGIPGSGWGWGRPSSRALGSTALGGTPEQAQPGVGTERIRGLGWGVGDEHRAGSQGYARAQPGQQGHYTECSLCCGSSGTCRFKARPRTAMLRAWACPGDVSPGSPCHAFLSLHRGSVGLPA